MRHRRHTSHALTTTRCAVPVTRLGALLLATLLFTHSPVHAAPQEDNTLSELIADTGDTAGTPIMLPGDVIKIADVPYGNSPRQQFDVYKPRASTSSGLAPMVVMVHGGAWMVGDKGAANVVENKIARWVPRGFVFVSVNYRMMPQANPQLQAQDVAHALATVQSRAREWGGDASHLVLMGHSAGAHLVALLAADPAMARAVGAAPWRATVALDSAALDLPALMQRRHPRFYDRVFGNDPAFWAEVSPAHRITSEATPMLLVCSTRRRDKPCAQAQSFAARMPAGRATVLPQDLSHGQINAQLGLPGAYTDAVEAFMVKADPAIKKHFTN